MIAATLVLAAPAAAQSTGGTTPQSAESAPPLTKVPFGVKMRRPAEVRSVACVADCAADGAAHTDSRLRLRGRRLKRTYEVVFLGAEGEADDVSTAPQKPKRRHRIDVLVPLGAVAGPIVVADRDGQRSQAVAAPAFAAQDASMLAGGPPRVEVQAQARRAYFDAAQPAEVTYVVHGDSPANVAVELVRERDAAVIARWDVPGVQPGTLQTVTWDGTAGGAVQRTGRYSFRVSAITAAGARAVSAQAPEETGAPDPSAFQFHGRAGHYIVVDGEQTGVDYSYMHMRDAALVDEGDRVHTGQLIGYVGDTGSASACHLHFEMWSAPGWYEGGSAFDPLPALQRWDRSS